MQGTPSQVDLPEINDDLVGFFNSVPREQILHSLGRLAQMYKQQKNPACISVSLHKQPSCESAWPGKPRDRFAKHIKFLRVSDLEDIVAMSFKAGVFTSRSDSTEVRASAITSAQRWVIQRESCWQRKSSQFLISSKYFDIPSCFYGTKSTTRFCCALLRRLNISVSRIFSTCLFMGAQSNLKK